MCFASATFTSSYGLRILQHISFTSSVYEPLLVSANVSLLINLCVCVCVLAHNTGLRAEETDSVPELSIQ